MKYFFLVFALFLEACSSTTVLVTNVPATVYDKKGNVLGVTPYKHTDRKPSFSKTHFVFKSDVGILDTFIVKKGRAHAGAIVGAAISGYGIFWAVQYEKNNFFNIKGKSNATTLPK